MKIQDYNWFMSLAIEQADKAKGYDEVPVGAVIISPDGKVIASAHNQKEKDFDPCGHAEILALTKAGDFLSNWRLSGCTLVVTLEPCPMCLSAMVQARIERVVFGAYDKKGGAISLGYDLFKDHRFNHRFAVMGGIKHYECSRMLSKFFRERRNQYKSK